MLGSGKSSASIWTAFDTTSTATVRLLKWLLKIAWRRAELSGSIYAVVGTSLVNGVDLVQGQSNVVSKSDLFQYYDETDRAVKLEYEREVLEPLGGIALAQADITLENTDGRFSPNVGMTVGTSLFPNRPIAMQMGFEVQGQSKTLPVFKGLSDQPKEDKMARTVKIHCYDYLKYINQYELSERRYVSQRSDQIIDDILQDIGFSTDQYVLDTGLNTIGFAWFTKGTRAGEAIRKLCEAEEAFFYQDEEGILRFENRRKYNTSPYNDVVWTIKDSDIIEWEEDNSTPIINRVLVSADVREVQAATEIWRHGIIEEIPAGGSITLWAQFEDPITSLTPPLAGTDFFANAASDGSGTDLTFNINTSSVVFSDTVKITLDNTATTTAYITFLRLSGTPAKVVSQIRQVYQDDDSIDKYERQQLEIDNDLIDSEDFAYYMARAIVRKYKDPRRRIRIRIRGVPQLQPKDKISVYDRDTATYKNYRLMKIQGVLSEGGLQQVLTLREVTSYEADSWAVVGTDTVEGPAVVGA